MASDGFRWLLMARPPPQVAVFSYDATVAASLSATSAAEGTADAKAAALARAQQPTLTLIQTVSTVPEAFPFEMNTCEIAGGLPLRDESTRLSVFHSHLRGLPCSLASESEPMAISGNQWRPVAISGNQWHPSLSQWPAGLSPDGRRAPLASIGSGPSDCS